MPPSKPRSPSFPAAAPAPSIADVRLGWLAGAGLLLATIAAYWPALGGALLWDDDAYVTRLDLRSLGGLARIWFDPSATEQYYPVLHSAFWLEHRLWGDAPLGYHLANVLLHATAAWLFVLVLKRLSQVERVAPNALARPGGRTSALGATRSTWEVPLFAGLLFALHPVAVESVAWISEQKNTLSTVFYLAAALAYLRYDRDRKSRAYAWALGLFVLAILSKSVAATLPAALLVVFWWQRGRLSWKRDAVPLLPWFALGAAAGLFTGWVERTYIGAQGADFDLTLLQRSLVAGREIWFYLGKLLWPADLIFIYPHWTVAASGRQLLFPLGALALLAAGWLVRGRSRAPLAALLLFVGTLFPTLGFFNVYAFIFSYVADHWQYLASLGIIALAAAGWGRLPVRPGRFVAVAVLGALGVLTWRQCGRYDNPETFYRTILARNPAAWMAHDNLGVLLGRTGRWPEAIEHYEAARRLRPDSAEIYHDLGTAMAATGQPAQAIADFEQALRIQPRYAEAHYHLGSVLARQGRMEEAAGQFEQALAVRPDYAEAENNLGGALAMLNRLPEATEHFSAAVRLQPGSAAAHANLGKALAQQGRIPEAVVQFRLAVRLDPNFAEARQILAQLPGGAGP